METIPYPDDLVYGHEASAATGVPEQVIRQWASRGRIRRYPGDGRPSGQGHGYRTMYALPDVRAAAAHYRPRAPKTGSSAAVPRAA